MSHPMAKQAAASTARRLKALGGKPGKPHGRAAVQIAGGKYPSKGAGSQVPFFASGGITPPRADRLAFGGMSGMRGKKGGGGKKGGHTTNVIIAGGGPGGGPGGPPAGGPAAVPVPVPRPVPVPVGGPGALPPVRPPIVPPGGAAPPGGLPPQVAAALAARAAAARPPGMKAGGAVKAKDGGSTKRQIGGVAPVAVARPVARVPVVRPPVGRPLVVKKGGNIGKDSAYEKEADEPIEKVGKKHAKGGAVHDDEAQDKKLIKKMLKEEDKGEGQKRKGGGAIYSGAGGDSYPVMHASAAGGLGRLEKAKLKGNG